MQSKFPGGQNAGRHDDGQRHAGDVNFLQQLHPRYLRQKLVGDQQIVTMVLQGTPGRCPIFGDIHLVTGVNQHFRIELADVAFFSTTRMRWPHFGWLGKTSRVGFRVEALLWLFMAIQLDDKPGHSLWGVIPCPPIGQNEICSLWLLMCSRLGHRSRVTPHRHDQPERSASF